MALVVSLLIALPALLGFLFALFLLLQVLAAAWCFRAKRRGSVEALAESTVSDARPSISVLVPAHNEEAVIAKTLRSIRSQITSEDRLLVVADNCTDRTAMLALEEGAEVFERVDEGQRGKGYALAFGVEVLAADPRDVLVVIDADCELAAGSLYQLTVMAATLGRPVQALNLMHPPTVATLMQRFAAFAWRVKNQLRACGSHFLGYPVQLMGTGFAMPWATALESKFASASVAEDMQMGVELAVNGASVAFCPEALVTSDFPASDAAAVSQRRRWEHGHLETILSYVPRLLVEALRQQRIDLIWLAIDVAVPPLALLVMMLCGLFLLTLLGYAFTLIFWPSLLALSSLAILAFAVLVAWSLVGREFLGLSDLFAAPWYMLRKLPLYIGFFRQREDKWVRTDRDDTE